MSSNADLKVTSGSLTDAPLQGDALARAVGHRLHASDRVAAAWGIELLEVRVGYARIRMPVRGEMLNGHAMAHGGIIFALADTALAHAANSHNTAAVTQQASIVFLSPAREGEILVAEASERTLAGRSGIYDVDVRSSDGRMLAVFHGLTRTTGGGVVR